MQIIYSPTFLRQYKKLEQDVRRASEKKECIFRENPHDTRLKTHKLHGRLENLWAFSITVKIRVVFEFAEEGTVIFHAIGPHDIYA